MKESLAEERIVLQDRLDWRGAKEKLESSFREEEWEEAIRKEMSGRLEVCGLQSSISMQNRRQCIIEYFFRQS